MLNRVEVESTIQHVRMNRRVFMAGESDESHLTLLPGSGQRFQDSIRLVDFFRIVIVDDLMNLPYIQVIGLQTGKGFFQHPHGDIFLASMRAHTQLLEQ
jgi:hypothetical protein